MSDGRGRVESLNTEDLILRPLVGNPTDTYDRAGVVLCVTESVPV